MNRCCALESCGKPLVKRADEYPFTFKKRKFCNRVCSGKHTGSIKHPRKPRVGYVHRPGSGKSNLCKTCGTLPHRVPGGAGCVCSECGTAYAPDRVLWVGSLVQSNAGMALPYSVE